MAQMLEKLSSSNDTMPEAFANDDAVKEAGSSEMGDLMEELKEVLTPEQIEEFGAMKARHMQLRSKPSKAKK